MPKSLRIQNNTAKLPFCIQPNYCTVRLGFLKKNMGKFVVKYVPTYTKGTENTGNIGLKKHLIWNYEMSCLFQPSGWENCLV